VIGKADHSDIDPCGIFDIRLRRSICADALDMRFARVGIYIISNVQSTYIEFAVRQIYRFAKQNIDKGRTGWFSLLIFRGQLSVDCRQPALSP